MARCSICYTLIGEGDAATRCPECRQEYHEACWSDLGGCGTYGCPQAVPAQKTEEPAAQAGWGDTKGCPSCGREIASSLLVCRCGAEFPYADPMTPSEFAEWRTAQDGRARRRRTLVLLFVFSLLGLPAPLLGAMAGRIAYRNRKELAGADGTYLAVGYGTAVLGASHTLIILLLLLGL